jgi:hypothetical protein
MNERIASPTSVDVDTVSSSHPSSHLDPPGPARTGQNVIHDTGKGSTAGKHAQPARQQKQKQKQAFSSHRTNTSKAQIALSDPEILDRVFRQLWDELIVHGREARQSYFRNLTVVAKSWVEPASQWLWMCVPFQTAAHTALWPDSCTPAGTHTLALLAEQRPSKIVSVELPREASTSAS